MKILIIVAILFSSKGYTQKLQENQIDDFTKKSIKSTSYETINYNNKFMGYVKIRKVDDRSFLYFKMMLSGSVFAVEEGDKLMMITETDSVITIHNSEFKISCEGCGAKGILGSALQGVELKYELPIPILTYLSDNKIKKMRIYTKDGYVEDTIKEKNASTFIKLLKLVQ